MKLRSAHIVLLVMLTWSLQSIAQYPNCPPIPEKYGWVEDKDYVQDRESIIRVLKWLCTSPPGWQLKQRSLANAYVLEWLAGTPEFSLDVKSEVVPSLDKFPDLLNSLMHGMALYKLEHPEVTDSVKLHTEGLAVIAELAMQSKELAADREIRKLIKNYKRHKLKAFVKLKLDTNSDRKNG